MKIISRKEAIEQGLTRYFTGKPCPQGHVAERYTRKSGCVQCDSEGQKHRILVKKGMAEPKPKPVNLRKQAIDRGERYYFTGKPCPRGHVSKRHVTSGCVECWPTYGKTQYERHKDRILERSRQNQHKYREQRKEYALKNKEYLKQKTRERNQRPEVKERNRKRHKEYWLNNKERRREIANRYANSAKGQAKSRVRQLAKRNATPTWVCLESLEVKHKERITMSRLTGVPHHIDHIVPLQGDNVCGLHVPWNLRVITAEHNLSKHNKWSSK